ncbi:S8 family serine peptidase [Neobacillus bataviensis]|uniref:S8 family serine peptidase n=1 Tax=Neobacillus bataviensis TaxID=220685 RepID=UPI001CC000A4|nr:S8 family serine peptidase [Neobacillus bataviensis]
MKKKFIKKAMTLTLGVGLISSSLSNMYLSFPSKVRAETILPKSGTVYSTKAEQILASLTKEQRDALTKLQVTERNGLQGFDEEELKSDNEISVIVEFKSKPEKVAVLDAAIKGKNLTAEQAKNKVDHEHATFDADLKKIFPSNLEKAGKKSYEITRSYKTTYNGVSMKLPANEVETLLQADAVKAVYKSVTFTIEPPIKSESNEEVESTKRIESIPFLGVDKLHKEGITGKGVKVGVIDTGVDYHHPDLKAAFKGGYDFVDNDSDPMETSYDDWKKSGKPETNEGGSSYYTSHGTHVSGTIAGRAKNTSGVAVAGIAPDAELYGYRALGPYGTGELDDILAAIEKSVKDGMDVINLSLGANINDPQFPTSTAINYAVLNGVTAVVAAGNSGPYSYTVGSPGAAALALTVGASSTPIPVAKYTGELDGVLNKTYDLSNLYSNFTSNLKSFEKQTIEIVDLGVGTAADYTNKDVNGKIVLVNTGGIGTQTKVIYAKEHGALAVLTYNNTPGAAPTSFVREDQNFIPTFTMTYEQGVDFKAQLAAGNNKLTFKNYKEENTGGDELAWFSSRGPTRTNYDIKPEITAPGVSVLSSVPAYTIYKNDQSNYQFAYNRMSGTSMATPHVAGISALLLQVKPNLQPSDIKTILMNTAKPLAGKNSVFDVGAGRVDAYRAVHTGMELQVQDETPVRVNEENFVIKEETGGLSFGNHYANEETFINKSVKMTNLEDKIKKFDVDVQFQTDANGSLDASYNNVTLDIPKVIPVQSLKTKKVPVSITIPATAKAGIYEGYITITNQIDKNEQYRIPFSVRTMEEGIESTSLSTNVLSPYHLQVLPFSASTWNQRLTFRLKSPMKWLDVVLVDGKTGKDLGLIETVYTDGFYDSTNYYVERIFEGKYNAFTGNPEKPISTQQSYVKPGYYQIKVIGTSERDHIFTTYNDVYVDPNRPTMTTSLDGNESPVYEYLPGQKTFPLQVKVIDEEVEKMVASGINVNQSINSVTYAINGSTKPALPVGTDGTINFDVPITETIAWNRFTVNGNDGGKNQTPKKNFYFVKLGTPYGYLTTDKTDVKMGETVSATLVLNNVDKLKTSEWTLSNIGQNFEIVDAKANEALANYGTSVVNVETTGNTSKVKLTMDGSKTVSGNISAIDLTLKVKDAAFAVSAAVNPTVVYTTDLGNRITISSAGMEWQLQSTFSELTGSIRGAAVLLKDYTKLGATIRVIDANGTVYDGTSSIARVGDYRISKLPITDKPFTWEMKLPGHFMMQKQIQLGVEKNGSMLGQLRLYYTGMAGNFYEFAVPGDVNQDNVIDVQDAIAIQKAWNTNNRAADINFDGIVDAKDIQFVIDNYLKQNSDVDNSPAPMQQVDEKTLQDILRELQISA